VDDLDKYILEQAKTEVEHTRSWPTKVLAFYVAINAAVVTGMFSLAARCTSSPAVSGAVRWLLTLILLALAMWSWTLLVRNHRSYLTHRNIQVRHQLANRSEIEKRGHPVPPDWFLENPISWRTRLQGWGFYAFLVAFVAALSISGVWVS
jgi:hypothetical protein